MNGRLGRKRWRTHAWVTCSLQYQGWRRQVMGPGYTHLFFYDEAVALAAGHRPCALCRRADYNHFRAAWKLAFGETPSAKEMDAKLHIDRLDLELKNQRRYEASIEELAVGTIVLLENAPWPTLLLHHHVVTCTPSGYGSGFARPKTGQVTVLTPKATVKILAAGFRPKLHPDLNAFL